MKGRGTRRCDFAQSWIVKDDIPDSVESQKQQFLLFDFFGNYDYFEKDTITTKCLNSHRFQNQVTIPNLGLILMR